MQVDWLNFQAALRGQTFGDEPSPLHYGAVLASQLCYAPQAAFEYP